MDTVALLIMGVCGLLILIMVLTAIYIKMSMNEKKKRVEKGKANGQNGESLNASASKQSYTKQSIFDFMEFDRIEDNMIIQKDDKRYLMVLECQGINYDLMSGMERVSVEEGFAQFLNTLRHPIQIYTQTRTINLESSLQTYKKRLEDIKLELERKEMKYKQMQSSKNYTEDEMKAQNLEIIRDKNLYEYGKDIIYYTEKMSLNKSVLRKQYYVIIPYYSAEAGNDLLDKDEIKNLAFSELYTKAQSLARVLAGCSVIGKVLDSYELADLLYSSYNRDESETYGFDRALRAGYDELYSTAPDVLDKKMEELNKEIEKRAYELAEEAVSKARNEKAREVEQRARALESFASQIAAEIIAENAPYVGRDVAQNAINQVKNRKTKEEGGKGDVKEEAKRARKLAN